MKLISTITVSALAWLLTTDLVAQSITRSVSQSLDSSVTVQAVPGTDLFGDLPAWDRNIDSLLADVPVLPGVDLQGIRAAVDYFLDGELSFTGLSAAPSNAGIRYSVEQWTLGGLDENNSWGGGGYALEQWGCSESGITQGETRIVSIHQQASHSAASVAGDLFWQYVIAHPQYRGRFRSWSGTWSNEPNPWPIQFNGGWVTARVEGEITIDVDLQEVALVTSCTSQANSTGVTGKLSSFGSTSTSSEWLTVRASDLPGHAAAILFVGTQNASFPASNYTVCVGGMVSRRGGIQFATAAGTVDFEIDLIGRAVGDSVYLQVLHRDPQLAIAASNASAFFVTP